jgi:hypothetical protein
MSEVERTGRKEGEGNGTRQRGTRGPGGVYPEKPGPRGPGDTRTLRSRTGGGKLPHVQNPGSGRKEGEREKSRNAIWARRRRELYQPAQQDAQHYYYQRYLHYYYQRYQALLYTTSPQLHKTKLSFSSQNHDCINPRNE